MKSLILSSLLARQTHLRGIRYRKSQASYLLILRTPDQIKSGNLRYNCNVTVSTLVLIQGEHYPSTFLLYGRLEIFYIITIDES